MQRQFYDVLDAVWALDTDATTKLVAMRLARHWPNIFPGVQDIAHWTGLDERTVRRALRRLEETCVIRITKRSNSSSVYEFVGVSIPALGDRPPLDEVPGTAPPPGGNTPPPTGHSAPRGGGTAPPKLPRANYQPEGGGFFDAPVIKVNPDKGTKVPAHWQPKPDHAARCAELGLNLAELGERFRLTEFNREYSDWDQRFSLWLIDERKRVETEKHRENVRKVHGYGKAPVVMEPSAKLVAYCKRFDIPLLQLMGELVTAGVVDSLGAKGATEELEKRVRKYARERRAS